MPYRPTTLEVQYSEPMQSRLKLRKATNMDDRSTDEDESGSETDNSVVANSVESARTPSPSILGGLEFLDRLIKRDTPADFEFKQQKKQCGQTPQNQDEEEKHPGKSPCNKSYSSCSKDAGLLQFPLFKPVQNYHHSPVFTPPRKSFLPPSDTDKDETILPPLALLSATSSLGLEITDGPGAYSQALFSSNQSSCPSLDLSFITGGNLSSTGAGEEARNQLSSLTDKIIHSITQASGDVDNQPCKLDEAKDIQSSVKSLTRPVGGTELSGGSEKSKSKQVSKEQSDEDVPENGGLAGYKSDGTFPLTAKETGTDCSGNSHARGNAAVDDGCKEKEEKLLSSEDGEISTKEKVSWTSEKEPTNAAMSNNNVDLRDDVTHVYDDKATHEGNGKGPTGNADAKDLLIEQASCEMQLLRSTQDESNKIDHILEEYKQVEAALKENDDSTVLSNLKEKLSTLKEKMKAEANSLKQKRDKILSLHHSHAATTTTTSQPKKEEELLGLSFKQKQILSLLTLHKELVGVLYSKMMETNLYTGEKVTGQDEGIGPNGDESTTTSDDVGKFSSIPTERMQTITQGTAESQFNKDGGNNLTQTQSDDEVTNSSEMDPTSTEMTPSQHKSTSGRTARIPHLTLKDLIDERVITPQKNCLSISGKAETSEAELLPDGSVMSENVWYKTEREWYAKYSNQPITAIKRPRLWNLITYKGELLSNLACQCQLLCIAKTINPIQSTTLVTKPPIPANSFKYQTKLPGERSVYKKQSSFYDSIDLSSIKSIYLIGNDELFPTEDLFQDGFWRNDGGSDSLVPPNWLNDLTRWEE
ncbi:uncharacterized protein [Apostichopus japonicus]|uniref:uncharacterized protein isoform X3 n=1 Tax=Stichopus japonicus TaxID=307972 RepID=UPI003AB381BA